MNASSGVLDVWGRAKRETELAERERYIILFPKLTTEAERGERKRIEKEFLMYSWHVPKEKPVIRRRVEEEGREGRLRRLSIDLWKIWLLGPPSRGR